MNTKITNNRINRYGETIEKIVFFADIVTILTIVYSLNR